MTQSNLPHASGIEAFLIADLEHFGQSMWRNEEVGDKRFSFFVTLVAAVTAGLATLAASKEGLDKPTIMTILGIALLGLLLIGFMTYLRMLGRNRVTDEYQRTLKEIRNRLSALYPQLQGYKVPVAEPKPTYWSTFWSTYLSGGYAETIGVINGALLSGHLIISWGIRKETAILSGLLVLIVQWVPTTLRRKTKRQLMQ